MANYDMRRALSLRQYSSRSDNSAIVFSEMIEVIIELAQTIKELTERVCHLESK